VKGAALLLALSLLGCALHRARLKPASDRVARDLESGTLEILTKLALKVPPLPVIWASVENGNKARRHYKRGGTTSEALTGIPACKTWDGRGRDPLGTQHAAREGRPVAKVF
jgi:hypothetical protein